MNAPANTAAAPRPETVETIKRILRETLRLGPEARVELDTPLIGGEHDLDSLDTLLLITTLEKQVGVKLFEAQAAGGGATDAAANGAAGRAGPAIDRGAFASVGSLARYVDLEARLRVFEASVFALSTFEMRLARLPHGEGFRYITRLLSISENFCAEGEWDVRGDEPFFRSHFPGDPIVPGVLISESLAQLSGLVGVHDRIICCGKSEPRRGRLARVDVKFLAPVRPPATIRLHSSVSGGMGSLRLFDVRAEVDGVIVASGQITLAVENVAQGASVDGGAR